MDNDTQLLIKRIEELESQLNQLQEEKKCYLIDRAVIALMTESDNSKLDCDYFKQISGISFHGNRYVICSFTDEFSEPGTLDEWPIWETLNSTFYYVLSDIIKPQFASQHACVTANFNGQIFCLVNLSDDLSPSKFKEVFRNICKNVNDAVEQSEGFRFQVFVSPIGFGLSKLPELRKNIESLYEYWKIIGSALPEVLFYDEVYNTDIDKNTIVSSRRTNEQFSDFVNRGDFEHAKIFFHETIVRDLLKLTLPSNILRFRIAALIDYMIQTLSRASQELGIDEVLDELNAFEFLLSSQNIDEMSAQVDLLLDTLNEKWKSVGTANQVLARKIRTYIDENYANHELNVNLVAEHFGVTASHITRIFQRYYHSRVLDYIQLVRIRAAKSLLGKSLTLGEIAEQTGYGSQINMIRAFKRIEGKTPREFSQKK